MITIRLARHGAKKRPFYHIVAAHKTSPRDGRFIEKLGYYNPLANGKETPLQIDLDRMTHWVSVGAKTTDRVSLLLKQFKNNNPAAA